MSDAPTTHTDELESPATMAAAAQASSRTPFATARQLERARELARSLAVAATTGTLYPPSHPLVVQSLTELIEAVGGIMDLGFEDVTVNIYKSTLFIENHVLPEESITYGKLIEDLLAHGISAVTLGNSFGEAEAAALVELLCDTEVTSIDEARAFLEVRRAAAITIAETSDLDENRCSAEERQNKLEARERYDEGVSLMRDVETQAKLGRVFEVGPLRHVVNGLLDSLLKDPAAILALTAIKSHDDYTLNHSINVCILALSLGSALGLDDVGLRSLGLSALLYDLGKVRIPESILNKEGPLTADEWQIVKSHAPQGADLLKRIQLVDQMPMVVAYEHHQRHDLQGYPEAEQGQREQHLFSRVVALCDAYDAMTTRRPFRREIRPDKALAVLMQGRNKAYDPSLTKALVAMLGIYPMGAVVRLTDGSTAVVFRVNRDDLLRPRVKRLIDAQGRWFEEPEVIDLRLISAEAGAFALSIEDCVPAADAGIDDVWQYL